VVFEQFYDTHTLTRKTDPIGFADATWNTIGTIRGRVEPVAGNEEFLNNQNFQGISEVMFCPIETAGLVRPDDVLEDSYGIKRINKGEPEIWRHILPYVMLKLERSQYVVQ